MQPAPVDAGEPGGQPAAELAADIGHRRPGERAGLLEAEVVRLQPSDLTGLPAADDAWAMWSGSTPILAQESVGEARSSPVRSATNTSSPALSLRVADEQLVDQAAGRLRDPRVQQGVRGDDHRAAGLGLAGGSGRREQAQVAVGDPAGLQRLARARWARAGPLSPPAFLAMTLRDQTATRPDGGR
jgi:hypothetical protein